MKAEQNTFVQKAAHRMLVKLTPLGEVCESVTKCHTLRSRAKVSSDISVPFLDFFEDKVTISEKIETFCERNKIDIWK